MKKIVLKRGEYNLESVLGVLPPEIRSLNWSLFEFDGILSPGSSFDVNVLSYEAVNSKNGFSMSSKMLNNFACYLKEVDDLILAGYLGEMPYFNDKAEYMERYPIVIEVFDSGDWEVSLNDSLLG